MPEIVYGYSLKTDKTFEKLVDDDRLIIDHIVLTKGDGLPDHLTNSNVYFIITKGEIVVKLENKDTRNYTAGEIISFPYRVQINIANEKDLHAELFMIKSPNPRHIQDKI